MPTQNHKDKLLQFINAIANTQLKQFANELRNLQTQFAEKKQSIAQMQRTLHALPSIPALAKNADAIAAAYDDMAIVTDTMHAIITSTIHKCVAYKTILKNAAADCTGASASELTTIHATVNTTQIELERLHAMYLIDVAQYTANIKSSEALMQHTAL